MILGVPLHLPLRRLQRRRQLPFRGLGRLLLCAGQLTHQRPNGVPNLLQQGPVLPVLLDKVVQHLPVLNHPPGVVGRSLIQRRLIGDFLPLGAVGIQEDAGLALYLIRHKFPECPVLCGGRFLKPVGPLVAQKEHHRVGVVALHQNLAALDRGVCRALTHAVHKPHPEPQCLGNKVDPLRRLLGQIGRVLALCALSALHRLADKVVIDQSTVLPGHRGILGRRLLPGQAGRRVVLSRRIGGKPLGLV